MSSDEKPDITKPFEKAAKERKSREEKDHDVLVGKRIRMARQAKGMTQQDLANEIGLPRFQQIQKYECGANTVSTFRLMKISEAVNQPITYFLSKKDKPQPAPTATDTGTKVQPS